MRDVHDLLHFGQMNTCVGGTCAVARSFWRWRFWGEASLRPASNSRLAHWIKSLSKKFQPLLCRYWHHVASSFTDKNNIDCSNDPKQKLFVERKLCNTETLPSW
jgi:hypothetical protein